MGSQDIKRFFKKIIFIFDLKPDLAKLPIVNDHQFDYITPKKKKLN
jgi:hypothetical protein